MKPSLTTRLFHAWFLMSRPMTLGVRAMAFDTDGRILLVRHTYVDGWHLPGGGVEIGETVHDALAKELREEANVVLGQAPVLLSIHFNRNVTSRDHVVVFRCEGVRQTASKSPDREIIAAEFFPVDELPADTVRSAARRIREWSEGSTPDPIW